MKGEDAGGKLVCIEACRERKRSLLVVTSACTKPPVRNVLDYEI